MNSLAPIVIFAYNRPQHLKSTVEALKANLLSAQSDLIIFSDGPKNEDANSAVDLVRDYAKSILGFKNIYLKNREYNFGLANNIIDGVTTVVNEYGKIIVLEDDLVTSPYFLEFMNEGLEKYERADEVISIHGYCVPIDFRDPVFFLRGADCWGWATWKRGWQLFNPDGKELLDQLMASDALFDFDFNGSYDYSGMLRKQIAGKVNSWAIRWYASAYLKNKLTLYPSNSLVVNIGSDGSGTHAQSEKETRTKLHLQKINIPDIALAESKIARQIISKYFYVHLGIRGKVKKLLRWGY